MRRALFTPLSEVTHCGGLRTGNVVKLVTNQIGLINAAAISEALTLGFKVGVEPRAVLVALKQEWLMRSVPRTRAVGQFR
jgi:3-hydroxyisobutyrate dehydrogenase-like beta-hydroxyacid dehydrogenase